MLRLRNQPHHRETRLLCTIDHSALACPPCGGARKIVGFIERRQQDVIGRILPRCGRWESSLRTLPYPRAPPSCTEPDPDEPRELPLVLDPEFL